MITRVALFLLLAVAVVAVVGRARRPAVRETRPRPVAARRCPTCGTYVLEGQICRCGTVLPDL